MHRSNSLTSRALILFLASTPGLTAMGEECPEPGPCLAQRVDAPADALAGRFGASMAQDGDRAIIARPLDDERGLRAGAVFIYQHDPEKGWVMEQKLTADDGEAGDLLGLVNTADYSSQSAVAISGDFAMAGAPGDDDNGPNAGAVYVFQRQESGWVQVQKLLAPEGATDDRLSAVALEGDVAVVGAPNFRGYALVFRYDGKTWTYAQELEFVSVYLFDTFGWTIDICGGIIAVGANGYDEFQGAVFVYSYDDGTERWELDQRLDAPNGVGNPQFGSSLDIGGDPPRLIVSAPFEQPGPRGAAYVYTQGESGWSIEQQLLATDCDADPCLFGSDVGIVSEPAWRAVVTTERFAAYEFRFDGGTWCETRQWQPPAEESDRHPVVSLQGEHTLLGTPRGGQDGDQGRVYDWDLSDRCACPADIDGSGDVGFPDLLAVLSAWGECDGCPEDLDGDDNVGFADVLAVLSAWGPCK